MEHHKFIVNGVHPVLLNIVSETQAILVCLLYQELGEKYVYSETVLEFQHPTSLKIKTRYNLIGPRLKEVMKEKIPSNTIISTFQSFPTVDSGFYYKCLGNTMGDECVDLLIPRHSFVKIKYMLDTIIVNGGYPKSTNEIFKKNKMDFIKVEKLELEGSKVIEKKQSDVYGTTVSIVKNAFKLINGPKQYTVIETLGVAKDIQDIDLRIPAPSYVFDKVYKDVDEVSRLLLDDGELVFFQYHKDTEEITVYTIRDYANIEKTSSKYWIKEEEE